MADPRPPTLLHRAGAAASTLGRGETRHPRLRVAARFAFVALVLGFLVAFVVTQWDRLPSFDWRFEPTWLLLGVPCVALYYVLHAEAWIAIVRGLGARLSGRAGRAVWGKSILARYVPTNALLVVGRVVLADRLGVGRRICVASIVYELGLAVCGAAIVGAYFVVTMPALEDQPLRWAVLLVVPLALVALWPPVFRRAADLALRKLGREPLPAMLGPARVGLLLAVYVVSWIAVGTGVFAFASALHPLDAADYPYVATAQAVAFGVAVATVVAPSGIGPRDATLAVALSAVLPLAVSTAIAIGFRLFQTAVELVFVAVVALADRRAGRAPGAIPAATGAAERASRRSIPSRRGLSGPRYSGGSSGGDS